MARPTYLDKINAEIRKAKKRNQKKLPPKKKSNVIGKPLNVAKGGGVGGLVKAKPKAKPKANGSKSIKSKKGKK
tara:strand:+ start:1175 stop:1396 length:222 start_codon:yes stop_codon:yes gene_type:complete